MTLRSQNKSVEKRDQQARELADKHDQEAKEQAAASQVRRTFATLLQLKDRPHGSDDWWRMREEHLLVVEAALLDIRNDGLRERLEADHALMLFSDGVGTVLGPSWTERSIRRLACRDALRSISDVQHGKPLPEPVANLDRALSALVFLTETWNENTRAQDEDDQ